MPDALLESIRARWKAAWQRLLPLRRAMEDGTGLVLRAAAPARHPVRRATQPLVRSAFMRHLLVVLEWKGRLILWNLGALREVLRWKWQIIRWKMHLFRRFMDLPHWIKLIKLSLLIAAIAGYCSMQFIAREKEIGVIYEQYYPYYYSQYRKTHPEEQARYYADYYARYYATYYTSGEYKLALKYALPEPTKEAFSYPQESKNAALSVADEAPEADKSAPPLPAKVEAAPEKMLPSEVNITKAEGEHAPPAPAEAPKTESIAKALPPLEVPESAPMPSHPQHGVALIKEFEGFSPAPYKDRGGRLTVGYGHLVRKGELLASLDEAKAESLLMQDIKLAEAIVKRNVTVQLNANQFTALVSLVYNIGEGQFMKSTLLRKLNQAKYADAADEFLRWKHVGKEEVRGLYKRRKVERELFLG